MSFKTLLRSRHPEFVFPRSATTRARREREGDDLYPLLYPKKNLPIGSIRKKFLE